ncbi:acyl-CoA dehydrogenase [Nonomuraea cavernae]|uniref:Acyl-CoA dehydrogenase FadE34 n=1 Tax=Nonomuraea cavernae TaxID=2045107 RepID=A0A917Z1P8_9ACTN|nr:acyl-CoA dehydrogenase [Nonomuraea cavernae]MCA2188092.1 acyl-CoA dehydrogenase [Nonomuraea cavernae]GGO72758.1 acyl-CoA dehydrogenase FadE34 [Nonomuraea cavernae]
MTIGLTEEHRDLRDAVRAFATREITPEVVRAAVDAKREELPAFWPALAEQGLLGLHLPEADGGAGYGLLELAVVAEELGRWVAPGPFLPTVLAGAVLRRAGHRACLAGLASGTMIGAVGLRPGGLTLTRDDTGRLSLSGVSEPVMGGHVAGLFVLPAVDARDRQGAWDRQDARDQREDRHGREDRHALGGGDASGGLATVWVVVARASVEVEDLPGHDLTRRLSRVTAADLTVASADVLTGLAPGDVPDLAATLFAAEASGIADRATATAADYAKVRHQFGRPIGQFQGVKHRCARMLVRAEQARVCAWDAARAADGIGHGNAATAPAGAADTTSDASRAEASLAAAVAGATSVEAAFATAKDCIQTLGGIGFTWEHDASLYLRRAQTLRILLGPTPWWLRRVARLTLDGVRRGLGVELPPEAEDVRAGIRAELRPALDLTGQERLAYLGEHGYAAPHLPAPWGKDADAVTQLVIAEEMRSAGLRAAALIIGAWVAPTLIAHGDAAQQERFLPATMRGDLVWCQLFSEPGAGSDLAALTTRAEKVEGGWKVTGQKVWTSMAREAHWGILLARTDPSAPKHRGLSYFLLDMRSPGIDIRPLRELTGDALFNEVFLDEVFVPDEMLVARPGDGWKLARTTLANERVSLSHDSSLGSGGEALLDLAAAAPHEVDDERLTRLGAILCDAQSGGLLGLRTTMRSLTGQQPGAESSVAKFIGVEHVQEVWETAMEWLGPASITGERGEVPDAAWRFLNARCMSIAGGTTDVQLNIIGERLLGLPRDPEPVAPAGAAS